MWNAQVPAGTSVHTPSEPMACRGAADLFRDTSVLPKINAVATDQRWDGVWIVGWTVLHSGTPHIGWDALQTVYEGLTPFLPLLLLLPLAKK